MSDRCPAVPEVTFLDTIFPGRYKRKLRHWDEVEVVAWRERCAARQLAAFDATVSSLGIFRR